MLWKRLFIISRDFFSPLSYLTAELEKKWQVSLGRMSKSQEAQNWTLLPEERNYGPDLGDENKNWNTVKTFPFREKHVHLFQ